MSTKRIALVAHSGGPTPVINASLCGVVEEARRHSEIGALYGAKFGLPGVFNQAFVDLFAQPQELLARVQDSSASALGGSRHAVTEDDLERVLEIFRQRNVGYFFYTGGNGSMGTAMQLQQAAERVGLPVRIIGIPKTIDNDILHTDHTPGYASCARFFAQAVQDIGADNRSLPNQVEILEVLGRNVGWLAAATLLGKRTPADPPHLVYLPEHRLPLDKLLDDVSTMFRRLQRCVVVVCEGQLDEHGEPFGADVRPGSRSSLAQNLGHRLSMLIAQRTGLRTRSEKPGLLGRATSVHVSAVDRSEAFECGRRAVQFAIAGNTGVMVTLQRQPGTAYAIEYGHVPLEQVAFTERLFPEEWRSNDGATIRDEFYAYAAPLVGALAGHPELLPSVL